MVSIFSMQETFGVPFLSQTGREAVHPSFRLAGYRPLQECAMKQHAVPSVRSSFTSILCIFALCISLLPTPLSAGQLPLTRRYNVHDPFTSGNLTIYPVTAAEQHDTRSFITLDEGLRNGEVEVTEQAAIQPMARPRPGEPVPQVRRGGSAQVNSLLLINHSSRPLVLLAGEIVTGGKQDRVVGKDRIVAPKSEPVDLNVFCVEPGRWTERAAVNTSATTAGAAFAVVDSVAASAPMAQISVRHQAMVAKDQQKVWDQVNESNAEMKKRASVEVTAAGNGVAVAGSFHGNSTSFEVNGSYVDLDKTSSYSMVQAAPAVKQSIDNKVKEVEAAKPAAPPDKTRPQYTESLNKQLHDMNAVGVVVAVNGEIIWADIFADSAMLQKYWPKLVRSYASESMTKHGNRYAPDAAAAQRFLDDIEGTHEVVDQEPGVFRHTEISGHGYKVFALTALLPKTGFDVHL